MEIVTLNALKEDLRVTHSTDDTAITRHANRAEQIAFQYTGHANLAALNDWMDNSPGYIDLQLEFAVTLMAKDMYNKGVTNPLTEAVKEMLNPFRRRGIMGGETE